MNNKLIARVAAGAMAVAMLGTVSFATKIDANKTTVTPTAITDSNYLGQAEKTFMAFATDTNDANFDANSDVIIALGQESILPGTIPVDSAKLAKRYVAAVYSGTAGNKVTSIIDVSNLERTFTLTTNLVNVFAGTTAEYRNVAYAEFEFPVKGSTLTKVGVRFTKDGNSADVAVEGTEFNGTGAVKYAAALYNVDSTDFEGMTAVPFAEYADYVE